MQAGKLLRWLFVALVCVIGLPAVAGAQSAIGGTVKDASGAVLPGVTVEVASDVLIEKTKAVSTDGQGQYTIVDLRPGVYTITFSLQGFNTFKREGLDLPSNFTATVNADLKVGALEESVTVSGASPKPCPLHAGHARLRLQLEFGQDRLGNVVGRNTADERARKQLLDRGGDGGRLDGLVERSLAEHVGVAQSLADGVPGLQPRLRGRPLRAGIAGAAGATGAAGRL